jgi:hypothetical protein
LPTIKNTDGETEEIPEPKTKEHPTKDAWYETTFGYAKDGLERFGWCDRKV